MTALLLNHKAYQNIELLELCEQKLSHPNIPDWEKNIYAFIQKWLDDADILIVKTSGSTGRAKCIEVSKQAMKQSAQMTGQYFQLKPKQTALLCLPTTHIAGQMMIVRAFVLGLNLITLQPQRISLNAISEQSLDFAAMLPLQVQRLLTSKTELNPFAQIKTLLIGGASLNPKLLTQIQNLNTQVYQSYAMTETLSHIAIRHLTSPQAPPFYTLLEGITIEQDARGCLIIHAPHLEVKNLITHDVVKLHSPTQFELLGRWDNVINSGGVKINPELLEAQLETWIPTHRFFISSFDDDRLGQKLVLIIEGDSLTQSELKRLKNHIKKEWDKYQHPKAIYFLPRFEETSTGKIQRQMTRLKLQQSLR